MAAVLSTHGATTCGLQERFCVTPGQGCVGATVDSVLVNEADVRTAVRSSGRDLWNPQHMAERELTDVSLEDVVALPVGWLAIGRAPDGTVLVAPAIGASRGLRRARPGDGVVASLLDVLRAGGSGSLEAAGHGADL